MGGKGDVPRTFDEPNSHTFEACEMKWRHKKSKKKIYILVFM